MRHGLRAGRRLASVAAAVALAAAVPGMASAAVTWTIQATPAPGGGPAFPTLSSVSCASATFCVATDSGGFPAGDYQSPGVEVWNGSAWTPQILPIPSGAEGGTVKAVSCASVTSCVAIGSYHSGELSPPLAEMWNGSSWSDQAIVPEDGKLNAISCGSPTSCTAVGNYDTGSDVVLSAEHWNGTTWKEQTPVQVGETTASFQAISCPTAFDCTAVGNYNNSESAYAPLIESWKGGSWQVGYDSLPAGEVYAPLNSVSCTTPDTCFAAGTENPTQETSAPMAMRTVDGSWTAPVSTLPAYASGGELNGISCTRPNGVATVCSAAGGVTVGTSTDHYALAQYWNGHTWISQATEHTTPSTGKTFASVSCAPGTSTCEAGGNAGNQALAEGN
jgi:hypothetical protein